MIRARSLALLLALVPACDDEPEPAPPPKPTRHYVFRAVSGVSMGGIGAAAVGPRHPEKFDLVAALGGPIDVAYLLGGIERQQLSGFCPYQRLADAASAGVDLNDPEAFADCMGDVPGADPEGFEHTQSFNHFKFTKDGGTFDRSAYLEIFEDLALAFGNPAYHNPASTLFPHPALTRAKLADLCTGPKTPIRIPGYLNKEFNPRGVYDAIAFCDGEDPAFVCRNTRRMVNLCTAPDPEADCATEGGATQPDNTPADRAVYWRENGLYNPCVDHHEPVTWALAVDFNGNGKREFAEPVVGNGHERFQDVGHDGCPSRLENGSGGCVSDPAQSPFAGGDRDPNRDDHHFRDNPAGEENSRKYDPGEPFEDFGLDGVRAADVPGAIPDYGEGNGVYDDSPNRKYFFGYDAASNFARWTPDQRARVDFYVDGGIRDLFNLGVSGSYLMGGIKRFLPDETAFYDDWLTLPSTNAGGGWPTGYFNWEQVAWTQMPRNTVIRYGKRVATPEEIYAGEGDHVGGSSGILNRLTTFYFMLSAKWAFLGNKNCPRPQPFCPIDGAQAVAAEYTFPSAALGTERDFAVGLPPGYAENPGQRYPVVYVGHGYGMDPAAMAGLSLISGAVMAVGKMVPMIFVFPNGRCCYRNAAGDRKCTEREDVSRAEGPTNKSWSELGYKRECVRGNFYVDAADGSAPYEQAYLELMDYIDAHYRTLQPQDVPIQ